MPRKATLPPSLQPLGLRASEAAAMLGISETMFRDLVREGRMPRPKLIRSVSVWDRRAVERAFDDLEDSAPNPFDRVNLA